MKRPRICSRLNDLTGCAPGTMMAARCRNAVPDFFQPLFLENSSARSKNGILSHNHA